MFLCLDLLSSPLWTTYWLYHLCWFCPSLSLWFGTWAYKGNSLGTDIDSFFPSHWCRGSTAVSSILLDLPSHMQHCPYKLTGRPSVSGSSFLYQNKNTKLAKQAQLLPEFPSNFLWTLSIPYQTSREPVTPNNQETSSHKFQLYTFHYDTLNSCQNSWAFLVHLYYCYYGKR